MTLRSVLFYIGIKAWRDFRAFDKETVTITNLAIKSVFFLLFIEKKKVFSVVIKNLVACRESLTKYIVGKFNTILITLL